MALAISVRQERSLVVIFKSQLPVVTLGMPTESQSNEGPIRQCGRGTSFLRVPSVLFRAPLGGDGVTVRAPGVTTVSVRLA